MSDFSRRRIAAFIIDNILLAIFVALLVSPFFKGAIADCLELVRYRGVEQVRIKYGLEDKFQTLQLYVALATLLVYVLYNVVIPYFSNGMTFGKYFTKLKIVNKETKEKPSVFQLVKRSIFTRLLSPLAAVLLLSLPIDLKYSSAFENYLVVIIASVVTVIIPIIIYIVALAKDDGHSGIHDRFAKTAIVSTK